MAVVSDTSPISNLAIIGRLGLLKEQFGQVLVPSAVRTELARLRVNGAKNAIATGFEDGWLRVTSLEQPVPIATGAGLHLGETEALGLAVQKQADLLLLDDGDARREAADLGLRIVGVLGILLRARRDGRLSSLSDEIRRLRSEAHFFIAPKLEAELLVAAGES